MKQVISCGMAACENELEESVMWAQQGNYLLVGFSKVRTVRRGIDYYMNVPVWRKLNRG